MRTEDIVHREILDREPTILDRMNKVGLKKFIAKLQEAGWVSNDNRVTSLVPFSMEYEGNAEKGNNYFEWKARLEIKN